jgi:hypothetical protein
MHAPAPIIDPPDVGGAIAGLIYPGRPRAVVRFSAEMLGTALMAAYPWSDQHGWTACN